jgi:rare lipoprotein A
MMKKSLWMLCVALALSACSTSQKLAEKQQSAAPVVDAVAGPSGKTGRVGQPDAAGTAPAAGSGGYLAGDGPGADAPTNLDSIADAVPKAEPLHRYANRPYSALGKTYAPLQATGNFKQRGIASWYGKKFHGQRTSIGEIYDMYGMTAAHPTLPIPSYARVTNPANGKSVIVRINDRGPFLHSRIMDLSYVAAYKLGYINTGSAEVEVESIAVDRNAPVIAAIEPSTVKVEPLAAEVSVDNTAATTGQTYLQLGAFKSAQGAESFLLKMRDELGESAKPLKLFEKEGLTRVHLGPYANANEARNAANQLESKLGFKPFVSVH